MTFPLSAYATSLALDDRAVYLLTSNAAYRLAPGEPARGIELELGVGAALTASAFIFWSKGAIWRAPKEGGISRKIAKFEHQPQYFVAFGEAFAWVDLSDDGLYTIQALDGPKPRVLVSSTGELSALNLIGNSLYFIQRPTDASWRIGLVAISGGEPRFTPERKGRRPAMLASSDQIYYYDLDGSQIARLSLDLGREETLLKSVVCSPISVASAIYCGSVEGLFEVDKEARKPRILVQGRSGSITNVVANPERIVWTTDVGADKLAVDQLSLAQR